MIFEKKFQSISTEILIFWEGYRQRTWRNVELAGNKEFQ